MQCEEGWKFGLITVISPMQSSAKYDTENAQENNLVS